MKTLLTAALVFLLNVAPGSAAHVTTADALVAAVRDGAERSTIEIGPGTFELAAPLEPKTGMTLKGAGMEKTIISGLVVRHNHIITRTTPTPRKEGLFGFNEKSDFATIQIIGNIIECEGEPRPLLRNDPSRTATIRDNVLKNMPDAGRYAAPRPGAKAGLEAPLAFECGVHGELTIDGWKTRPTGKK